MANKLKSIFSDDNLNLEGKIHFSNRAAADNFIRILNKIHQDGGTHRVEDVNKIETYFKDGSSVYPRDCHGKIMEMYVGPSIEHFTFSLNSDRNIDLFRYNTVDSCVIYNDRNEPLLIKIEIKNTDLSQLVVTRKIENARDMLHLRDSYLTGLLFLKSLFIDFGQQGKEKELKNQLEGRVMYFTQLLRLQEILKKSINPRDLLTSDTSTDRSLQKLYYLLCERQIIRTDKRLNSITQVEIPDFKDNDIKIGQELVASFLEQVDYELFGNTISIYEVNAVFNCIVSDIKESDTGKQIIFNDSTETMFVSISGYLSEQDAEKELNAFSNRIELYKDAKSLKELIFEADEKKEEFIDEL